jgi:hypothetical protein
MFPSPNPHTQLQAIKSVEAADPLAIHSPAFTPQQHPDPQVPEPRPGMGEIPNAEPEP